MNDTKKTLSKELIKDCEIVLFDLGTIGVPDGYDTKSVPDLTRSNIMHIIRKHNQLLSTLQKIVDNL